MRKRMDHLEDGGRRVGRSPAYRYLPMLGELNE
jgi:hypothetical protein